MTGLGKVWVEAGRGLLFSFLNPALAMSSSVRHIFLTKPVGWREGGVLVATAWLVPFLVHLIPWAGPRPIGVHLLPIFWTTFVAVYWYGALPGLAIGLVAPVANALVTGLPAWSALGAISLELALFVGVAATLVVRWPGFWAAAPLAWLAAKAGVILLQWVAVTSGNGEPPLAHWVRSTQNGLVGLGVLAVIGWLLAVFYPRTPGESA